MSNVFIHMKQDLRGGLYPKVYTRRSISFCPISIREGVVTFRLKGDWEINILLVAYLLLLL